MVKTESVNSLRREMRIRKPYAKTAKELAVGFNFVKIINIGLFRL